MTLYVHEGSDGGLDARALSAALRQHGAVLLRAAGRSVEDFLRLSDELGGRFVSLSDEHRLVGGNSGRAPVNGLNSLFTVTGATGAGYGHDVPLHGELYFHHRTPPELLWFYCQQPALNGGATLVCDGAAVFEALPDDVQEALQSRPIVYERHHDGPTWRRLYGVETLAQLRDYCERSGIAVQANEDDSVATRFAHCAIRRDRHGRRVFINNLLPFAIRHLRDPHNVRANVRFADGEAIPADWVRLIEQIANELALPLQWQKGDVAIVDNTRTLHGRGPVSDGARTVYVRMSSLGRLSAV